MKNLVVCGNCEKIAGTSIKRWVGSGFEIELKRPGNLVLGEIIESGDFLIKRGGQNYTTIVGSDFSVICGKCGEEVYRKETTNGTLGDQWIGRVHWESFSGTF